MKQTLFVLFVASLMFASPSFVVAQEEVVAEPVIETQVSEEAPPPEIEAKGTLIIKAAFSDGSVPQELLNDMWYRVSDVFQSYDSPAELYNSYRFSGEGKAFQLRRGIYKIEYLNQGKYLYAYTKDNCDSVSIFPGSVETCLFTFDKASGEERNEYALSNREITGLLKFGLYILLAVIIVISLQRLIKKAAQKAAVIRTSIPKADQLPIAGPISEVTSSVEQTASEVADALGSGIKELLPPEANETLSRLASVDPRLILTGSVVSYVVSLFLPAIIEEGGQSMYGIYVLAVGLLGVLFLVGIPWLANLFFFLGFIESRGKGKGNRSPIALAALAVIFGLSSFIVTAIPYDSGSTSIAYYGPGFYFWILAFILQLWYFILQRKMLKGAAPSQEKPDSTSSAG